MPDARRGGPTWGPPPWWSGDRGRRGAGTHLSRRIFGLVGFMVVIGTVVGALIASGLMALTGPSRWLVAALTLLAVMGFGFVARGMFRRTWAPVGDLIEATRRLGDGESGVRMRFPGPGPFAAVAGSFNRMAERLEEEDQRRRRLFADIGHELRTPMTVIRGEIEAVLDGIHPAESLANVVDEVDVMDRLLDDLRILAMAEAGTLRLETEPTDLAELAREVLASFAPRAKAQGIAMEVDGEAPTYVEIDPYRLHQVLSNPVANALNQMPAGGELTVVVRREDRAVVLTVSDTGPGIDDSEIEHVFDRFVRASDSAGTGLGLTISRDLVEAHGGSLTARNTTPHGAVFVIRLPERTTPSGT